MTTKISIDYTNPTSHQQIFSFLILYRWLSLIPVLVAINPQESLTLTWGISLLISTLVNILITLFAAQLNKTLVKMPWIFLCDLAVCGTVFYLVGGWATPYYLYAFSPLLAAAFFFGLRGAAQMATAMSIVYIAIGLSLSQPITNPPELVTRVVGFFLIAGTVGYASLLLKRLQTTYFSLGQAHRDLKVIHSLANSLQSAADINEVQKRILNAVTNELGFPKAMIGLVDQDDWVITDWVGKSKDEEHFFLDNTFHSSEIPLKEHAGQIPEAILQGKSRLAAQNITTPDLRLNQVLSDNIFHIFPMILRDHPVGVLVIASMEIENKERVDSLQSITSQATLALGTTMLCIDRAQRLAIQEERIRIAREIHDTAAQSLFGLNFALDACVKLLPANPERVKDELIMITQLAEKTRQQIRQSIMDIWHSKITAETFAHDLYQYAHDFCYSEDLDLTIRVRGEFQQLSPRTKRGLYRVAQEAVTNIVRHSVASEALICLTVIKKEVGMIIRDNGRGFNVSRAFKQEHHPEHFGLSGIQERVESLDGTVEFVSQAEVGTAILIMLPINEVS